MSKIIYPSTSKELKEYAKKMGINKNNLEEFVGQTPADKSDCSCQKLIRKMLDEVGKGSKPYYIQCDRKSVGYKHYEIICNNCGHTLARCWAKDETLKDYFDLHYVCSTDGENWYGAMSLNLSPIDAKIGLECSCGQDTRDFRANTTLPSKKLKDKISANAIGKDFAKADSKFKVERKI